MMLGDAAQSAKDATDRVQREERRPEIGAVLPFTALIFASRIGRQLDILKVEIAA
jgi:hypothetical protein